MNHEEKKYKIYTLNEPCSNTVRYVGLTGQSIKHRFNDHFKCTVKTHKADWIRSVRKRGLRPQMRIIESGLALDQAKEKEIFYIKYFKELGFDLTNGTEGGDGIFNASPEVRAKIGKAHRGKKICPLHVERLRQMNLGRKVSEEHKIKLSAIHKGKKNSVETRKRMSVAKKGKPLSSEHAQKNRIRMAQLKGTKIPEERRLKMIGRKRSEATLNKASETMKQRFITMSPEKRANVNQHQRKFTDEQIKKLLEEKINGATYSFLSQKYHACQSAIFLNIKKAKSL